MGMFLPMQSDIFTNIWKSCVFRAGKQLVICDVYVYLHATWWMIGLVVPGIHSNTYTLQCVEILKKIYYTQLGCLWNYQQSCISCNSLLIGWLVETLCLHTIYTNKKWFCN